MYIAVAAIQQHQKTLMFIISSGNCANVTIHGGIGYLVSLDVSFFYGQVSWGTCKIQY